jgi:hypothetical protein
MRPAYEHLVGQESVTWGLPRRPEGIGTADARAGDRPEPVAHGSGHQRDRPKIEGPMAMVILRGLPTSMLPNLA